jgi:RecA/RadA recombinase
MPKPTTIAALRSLVTAWTPAPPARKAEGVATGVPALDAALGGGLPRGRVTELVSGEPSSGGELVLGALLASTRAARLRVALVDAADGFAPRNYPADWLRHLVWVRARSLREALGCADVLVRDGNYAVLVLDLRGVPARALRQQPAAAWHRLRLAAEQNAGAVLVQSPAALVPAVPWRLALRAAAGLDDLRRPRAERAAALAVAVERGHARAGEELAG